MRVLAASVLASLVLQVAPAVASDPAGAYALIEKVVVEPAEGAPERVQLWGAFCLAEGDHGGRYTSPVWGTMYFGLAGDDKDAQRRVEWKDMQSVAGKGEVIAFGWRYDKNMGRVRVASEPAADPDVHPLGHGLQRTRGYGGNSPGSQLLRLPKPQAPAPGAKVADARPTLTARNPHEAEGAKLVFEVELPDGSKIVSPMVELGEQSTSWQVPLAIGGGEHAWSVHAVGEDWTGTAAPASFTVELENGGGKGDGEKKAPATRPSN